MLQCVCVSDVYVCCEQDLPDLEDVDMSELSAVLPSNQVTLILHIYTMLA